MPLADQDEFERRLLALVRDYVADANAEDFYNDGWQIDDVIVIFKIREPPDDDRLLDPWDGGATPGWADYVAWTTTARSNWTRYAMLDEALRLFHARDEESPSGDDGPSEPA